MSKSHHYQVDVLWTGNTGTGTSSYRTYERSHDILINGKKRIEGSSDPAFRGDQGKHNPEELFVSSISSCHMLWFLHLCSVAKVVVLAYKDAAQGTMVENQNGKGQFTSLSLRPHVQVAESWMESKLNEIHEKAHEYCFIANSVSFEIQIEPSSAVGI